MNSADNTIWNDFYEEAWGARSDIIARLIAEGESHPLRVLKIFESIMRFSKQERIIKNGIGKFSFYEDVDYLNCDINNILTDYENRSISLSDISKLPNGLASSMKLPLQSLLQEVPQYTSTNKIDFLVDYCRNRKLDAILELGSGYSQNLIKLFYEGGPRVPYYAGEYTQSGVRCSNMLAGLSDELDLTSFEFDYRNPNFSILPKLDNILVFTSHSIEQVDNIPDTLLPLIANIAKNVTCIHFEPFGFQLTSPDQDPEHIMVQRSIFEKNQWNQNLASKLVFHHLNKDINLTYLCPNMFGGEQENPTSLAIWSNRHE